jgi:ABC-type antimicrobial peptide transport system permease subunit
VGLSGILSFLVSRRVCEMGVRAALGARPGQLRSLVVRRGAGLVLVGLAAGAGAALLLSGAVAGLLHGVPPRDPWSAGAASALLFLVAVAACLIPAWRASRVQPVEALRVE